MFYQLRVIIKDKPYEGISYNLPSEKKIIIGRNENSDIVLSLPEVSSHHAELTYDEQEDVFLLRDLKSKQGTFLKSEVLEPDKACPFHVGDIFQIGRAYFRIEQVNLSEDNTPITLPTGSYDNPGAGGEQDNDGPSEIQEEVALETMDQVLDGTDESKISETLVLDPFQTSATQVTDSVQKTAATQAPYQEYFTDPEHHYEDKEADELSYLVQQIQDRLIQKVDLAQLAGQAADEKQARKNVCLQIRYIIHEFLSKGRISESEVPSLEKAAIDNILGYGPLQDLMNDHQVSEIMVNRPWQIYYEKNGRIFQTKRKFHNEEHVKLVLRRLLRASHRRIDESNPVVNASLQDGSRLNAVLPPISLNGTTITIRKFHHNLSAEALIKNGTMSESINHFLKLAVNEEISIVISGGTGSGKTTFLNALSAYIPESERLITIEDTSELTLKQPHVVRLQARPANVEGKGRITIRDLVVEALRMRPDRIIVGECRHGEALDMLQAMNTGHDGSITTVHSNSAGDALKRLETMVLMAGVDLSLRAIREQIRSAVALIVHLERMLDGQRRIKEIVEITDMEDGEIITQPVFEFHETGIGPNAVIEGNFEFSGHIPSFLNRMKKQGKEIPSTLFI